jgi:hypothetical protein
MPEFLRLSNRLQENEFGFPRGTGGEVDETKAADQPPRTNPSVESQTFLNDYKSRFQGASEGYGAFTPFAQYLSGQGALTVSQPIFKGKDEIGKEQFAISPGGGFNLQRMDKDRQPSGFSVTGNPRTKSLGFSVPVGSGMVELEGSLNNVDPYVKAKFAFGGKKQPVVDTSEQQLNAALGVNQAYDPDKKVYNEPYARPEPSARELYNQMLSYTNDKNYSPAAALSKYHGQWQPSN